MKIAIRVPNWIGDSILSFPTIQSISQNFPQSEIWIIAKEWVKDLFLTLENIKGILTLPHKTDFKNSRIASRKIKEHEFDLGFLLTNSFSSALLFFLAKIPERWGYATDGRAILLTRAVSPKNLEKTHHQLHYYLNLLSALGLHPITPSLHFPLPQEQKMRAEEALISMGADLSKPLIVLNPGAAYGSSKRWPAERFAEVAKMFEKCFSAEILIIGSEQEKELSSFISSLLPKKPLNFAGQTDLLLLAGLISHASLFVTNDSGSMHLANSLKIPVVAIFGPTNPEVTGPFQKPAKVIRHEVACSPCSYRECPFEHQCMKLISVEEVFAAGEEFLR